jgi:hypothetical protein
MPSPYRKKVVRKSRKKPDWNKLWKQLRNVYEINGRTRQVAVLDNYAGKKEAICRKLGVICGSDVNRIYQEIKASQ